MLFILILLFSLTYLKADLQTDLKYIKACNKTAPISFETMNTVLIHKRLEDNSGNFKCFLNCLFTKYHWMDDEGGFLVHEIKQMLNKAQVEISSLEFILFRCTAITSVDKCERAFLFTQCLWKQITNEEENREENGDQLFYRIDDKK